MAFPKVETVQPFLARNRWKSRALVETLLEIVASQPPSWAVSVSASVISVCVFVRPLVLISFKFSMRISTSLEAMCFLA